MSPRTVLACLPLLALLGCGGMADTGRKSDPDSVKIGFLYNTASGVVNQNREMAARLAAAEINAAGGVNGKPVEILVNGDRADSASGPVGARTLLDQGVVAIVGGATSALTMQTAQESVPRGVPICAPSATSPALTNLQVGGVKVSGDLTWRTAPSDAYQGRVLAKQIHDLGLQKVAVIYRSDAYGNGLASTFKQVFEGLGGTVTAYVGYPSGKSSGFGTEVGQLFAPGTPDGVVMITLSPDGAALTRDLYALGPSPHPPLFAGDAVFNPDFLANAEPHLTEGMRGTTATVPADDPNFQRFAATYQARTGMDPNSHPAAGTYDAVYLFALAMQAQGRNTSEAVRQGLRQVSGGLQDGGTPVGVQSFAQAAAILKAGGKVDYQGASGHLDFDANGDVTSGVYAWWQVQAGAFTTLARVPFP